MTNKSVMRTAMGKRFTGAHLLGAGFVSVGFLGALCTPVLANDLYLDLSEESFMIRGEATHSSHDLVYFASAHITEDKGEAVSIGLMKTGQVGSNENLNGGIGAKAYIIDADIDTVYALGIGGRMTYSIQEVQGLSITGELFYAPSITISDDIDDLIDFHARANYAIFENGELYAGVRNYQLDVEFGDNYKFDTGPFFGIKLSF